MLESRKNRVLVVAKGKPSVTFVQERSSRCWALRDEYEFIKKRQDEGRLGRTSLKEGFRGLTLVGGWGGGLLCIFHETLMF